MSGGDEGFLTRWSRRKRAPEPEPSPAPAIAAPVAEPDPAAAEALEALIAQLPKVEDLIPGQNLSAFMQAGIPQDLKNAALRRMWTIDPAIRDFVGEALDYAYDYNTPGMAPGFGPLISNPEAVREVLAMFDRAMPSEAGIGADRTVLSVPQDNLPQESDARGKPPGDVAAAQHPMPDGVVSATPSQDVMEVFTAQAAQTLTPGAQSSEDHFAAAQQSLAETSALSPRQRRHGRALPQ